MNSSRLTPRAESPSPFISDVATTDFWEPVSSTGSPVGSASASAVINAAGAAISATATGIEATPPAGQFYSAGGESSEFLEYNFEVASLVTGTVNLNIEARGGFAIPAANAGSFSADAQADLYIVGETGGLDPLSISDQAFVGDDDLGSPDVQASGNAEVLGSRAAGFTGIINENTTAEVETNTLYSVELNISVDASEISANNASPEGNYMSGVDPGGTWGVTAFVDPYFNIAPGTPNSDEYSLVFSPGIGNPPLAAAVPELSTWVMMLLGLSSLALLSTAKARGETV